MQLTGFDKVPVGLDPNNADNRIISCVMTLNDEIKQQYPDLPTPDLMTNYKTVTSNILTDYKYQL